MEANTQDVHTVALSDVIVGGSTYRVSCRLHHSALSPSTVQRPSRPIVFSRDGRLVAGQQPDSL